eukprot:Ihof_evm1s352 gene=Ihof_evmTU1s352
MAQFVSNGESILLVGNPAVSSEDIMLLMSEIGAKAGQTGRVVLEQLDRLGQVKMTGSGFDVILAGYMTPAAFTHTNDHLAEFARLLKPNGRLYIREPTLPIDSIAIFSPQRPVEKITSALKMSGFISVNTTESQALSASEIEAICSYVIKARPSLPANTNDILKSLTFVEIQANKPSYELGATAALPLSLRKKTAPPKVSTKAASVWKVSASDFVDDADLMDESDLLDDDDLMKPDPSSLKYTCAPPEPGKKKRACKNCSCGLKEMQEDEFNNAPAPTSSCGS